MYAFMVTFYLYPRKQKWCERIYMYAFRVTIY